MEAIRVILLVCGLFNKTQKHYCTFFTAVVLKQVPKLNRETIISITLSLSPVTLWWLSYVFWKCSSIQNRQTNDQSTDCWAHLNGQLMPQNLSDHHLYKHFAQTCADVSFHSDKHTRSLCLYINVPAITCSQQRHQMLFNQT